MESVSQGINVFCFRHTRHSMFSKNGDIITGMWILFPQLTWVSTLLLDFNAFHCTALDNKKTR